MKISNSKKELARIISENGGWRDGAEFSVSTRSGTIAFSRSKPEYTSKYGFTAPGGFIGYRIELCSYLKNWHQTILSREEYFHIYPAPDADGWIECNGCDPQIDQDTVVEVKFRDGQLGHNPETVRSWCWAHGECDDDIIAYRLHKPEQAKPEFCESVTRSIPEPEFKQTIEQLAADYRNRKDYADRKQEEADAAKDDAEAKLAELVAAGKALNLVISVDEEESELVITDWRDLRIGDEVEVVVVSGGDVTAGEHGVIVKTDVEGFWSDFPSQKQYWYYGAMFERGDVKFIRRP